MYPMTFTHSPMLVGGRGVEERRRVRSMSAVWWEVDEVEVVVDEVDEVEGDG
jgi:hypothetical protein